MKKFVLFFIVITTSLKCFATNPDSLQYEHERTKINGMLAVRSQKFSQYTQSLDMHTGIFGLQTKKDIRRSNDILMEIVRTDEDIFKELKILLEYRAFQQTEASSKSVDSENHALAYMATINRLRDENSRLISAQTRVTNQFQQRQTMHIVVIILLILLSVFLLTRKRPTVDAK